MTSSKVDAFILGEYPDTNRQSTNRVRRDYIRRDVGMTIPFRKGNLVGLGGLKKLKSAEIEDFAPELSASEIASELLSGDGGLDESPRLDASDHLSNGSSSGLGSLKGLRSTMDDGDRGPTRESKDAADETMLVRIRSERYSSGTGFRILEVEHKNKRIIVKTDFPAQCEPGDHVTMSGTWEHYKGKDEFRAKSIVVDLPKDSASLVAWLSSGAVPGVGKGYATRLFRHFGEQLQDIITDPEKLSEAGIPPEKTRAIAHSWTTHSLNAEIFTKLHSFGLQKGQISAVMRRYGNAVLEIIQEHPWRLAVQIEGIAFPTADHVALRSGKSHVDPNRIKSAFEYILKEAVTSDGNCALPPSVVVSESTRLLRIDRKIIEEAIEEFKHSKTIEYDAEKDLLAPRSVRNKERTLASDIARIADEPAFELDQVREAIEQAERNRGIKLDPSQRDAAILALTNRFSVITGGPGTGKSTTQKVVVEALNSLGIHPTLAAPTGRAAKRLSEVSGLHAETCHRMLSFRAQMGGFLYTRDNPLPSTWLVKDETSMIDLKLASDVLEAVQSGAGVTMVGDVDQLPSVGPGQVLRDIIESGVVPVARLQTVHRQGEDSGIIVAANRINRGHPPLREGEKSLNGFVAHDTDDESTLLERVVRLVTETLPARGWNPRTDIQVLAAQKKGHLGTPVINAAIKARLNPAADDERSLKVKETTYTIGDRVIHVKNNHAKSVYNGEVGFVVDIRQNEEGKADGLTVDYDDRSVTYSINDLKELELCWASTIHKSQGSEYPVVVVVLPRSHKMMMSKNLIYTGVTRAKTLCMMVGDMDTVSYSLKETRSDRRFTHLSTDIAHAVVQLAEEKEAEMAQMRAMAVNPVQNDLDGEPEMDADLFEDTLTPN